MSIQVDKVITKILGYGFMSEIAEIVGIDLTEKEDYWIDYNSITNDYPKLIRESYVTEEELEYLKTGKADYLAFRLDI